MPLTKKPTKAKAKSSGTSRVQAALTSRREAQATVGGVRPRRAVYQTDATPSGRTSYRK